MEILVSFLSLFIGLFVIQRLQLSFKRVMSLILWPVPFFTFIMWVSHEGSSLMDIAKVMLIVFLSLFALAFPSLIAFALLVETAYKNEFIKSKFYFLLYAGFVGMMAFMFREFNIVHDSFYYVAMFVLHVCIAFFVYILPQYIVEKKKRV